MQILRKLACVLFTEFSEVGEFVSVAVGAAVFAENVCADGTVENIINDLISQSHVIGIFIQRIKCRLTGRTGQRAQCHRCPYQAGGFERVSIRQ